MEKKDQQQKRERREEKEERNGLDEGELKYGRIRVRVSMEEIRIK